MLIVEHLGNTKKKKKLNLHSHINKPYQQASNLEISTVKIWYISFWSFFYVYITLKKF